MGFWNKVKDFMGFGAEEDIGPLPSIEKAPGKSQAKNLVGFPQSRSMEIIINEPRIYEDSLNIAAHLRQGKPVLINLKYLDAESGKRLIDFVCGTVYAINGHMLKVGEAIFLFTPENVAINDSEEKASLERNLEASEREGFFRSK